jgi:hypothetical protein
MAMAIETIEYTLTSSVSHALGLQSYTFLKLTQQLTTESIFTEYTTGLGGQIPLSSLMQGFSIEPESADHYDDWTPSLQLRTRLFIAGAVMGVGLMEEN